MVLQEPEHGSLRIRAHLSWRTGKHLHVLHVLRTYSTCSYPGYQDTTTYAALITAFKAIGAVSVLNHFYGRKVKVWKFETLYAKFLVDACDDFFLDRDDIPLGAFKGEFGRNVRSKFGI